ncbi:MAG: hypothetical protein GKS06_01475 [Acidobacteria bacterium]|nr:hypothetical protein [Acidobacteriota bacterium]
MGKFRIEGSDIDVAALEARVEAAIESKRGTRFSDEDLARLRDTPLRPRLRREDLPRGLTEELADVRGRLVEAPSIPEAHSASAPSRDRSEELGSQRAAPDMASLWETGSGGLKGRLLGVLRRIARTVFHSTTNLEDVLVQQQDYSREMVATTERDLAALEQRLERSFDVLKDNLDSRIDRTADWAAGHMSITRGTLEERHERSLQLAHNLVVELTNARLDLQQMQARLDEMARRMGELETRGRTLEKLTLRPGDEG